MIKKIKRLKEEEKTAIIELYLKKVKLEEIAAKYNICIKTIHNTLKKAGIERNRYKKKIKLIEEPVEEIAAINEEPVEASKKAIYIIISEEDKNKLDSITNNKYISITNFFRKCINEEYNKLEI